MRPPLAALVLVIVLVTSGCLGGPSRPPSDQRAMDALNRSQDAMADVTSYRTTIDGRVEATGNDEQVTLFVDGTVTVNASTQEMNATGRVREQRGTRAQAETQMTYVTGYTAFSECSRMGWERQNLSQTRAWLTYTPVGQQLGVLNETNVYWNGTETINGTESAVIVAYPTMEELQAIPDVRSRGATDVGDANLDNATLRVWIDTDTGRPLKAQRNIRVSESGNTATATITLRFTDYNEPTSVNRPEFDEESLWQLGCPNSN